MHLLIGNQVGMTGELTDCRIIHLDRVKTCNIETLLSIGGTRSEAYVDQQTSCSKKTITNTLKWKCKR